MADIDAREQEIRYAVDQLEDIESDFYAPVMLRVLARLFPEKDIKAIAGAIILSYSEQNNRHS